MSMTKGLEEALEGKFPKEVIRSLEDQLNILVMAISPDVGGTPEKFAPTERQVSLIFPKFVWESWDRIKPLNDDVGGYEAFFIVVLQIINKKISSLDNTSILEFLALLVQKLEEEGD